MKSLFDSGVKKPMGDDTKYSRAIRVPQYEPKDIKPDLSEMYSTDKYRELMAKIKKSSVSDEEKKFLQFAATRHIVFTYSKIADYYAHASKEMQGLMEQSALVILDMDDAIANGYVTLTDKMKQLIDEEKERDKNAREAKDIMKQQQELLKEKLKAEENKEVKEKRKKEAEALHEALKGMDIDEDAMKLAEEMEEGFMELPDED